LICTCEKLHILNFPVPPFTPRRLRASKEGEMYGSEKKDSNEKTGGEKADEKKDSNEKNDSEKNKREEIGGKKDGFLQKHGQKCADNHKPGRAAEQGNGDHRLHYFLHPAYNGRSQKVAFCAVSHKSGLCIFLFYVLMWIGYAIFSAIISAIFFRCYDLHCRGKWVRWSDGISEPVTGCSVA
jgi:hypothetical protein